MKRIIKTIITEDGSSTLYVPELEEHYHSIHGAIQESYHVFINAGLHHLLQNKQGEIHLFEIGFGTGLNALLTYVEANKLNIHIVYHSVELYPITIDLVKQLHFELPEYDSSKLLLALHEASWDQYIPLSTSFTLHKIQGDANEINLNFPIDLVFFDAFAPDKQEDLWTEELFMKLFQAMSSGSILTTYCAKGSVRRIMQKTGFVVERIPGPPGKREMLRASKH